MDTSQHFHHYTDISALALILKNKTIRFNRLDHVDDISESEKYGEFHLSKYLFVSCWTSSNEESIPLWYMYSKGSTGVIISLPRDPFYYRPLIPDPLLGVIIKEEILSIFPLEKIFTENYMINIAFLFNKDLLIKNIEYVNYTDLKEIRSKAINLNKLTDGKFNLEVAGPTQLAGFKSNEWSFQKEVRYILMIYPTPPLPLSGTKDPSWISNIPNYFLKAISDEKEIDIDYIDVDLDPTVVNNINVILSPHASESDRTIVEALLNKYSKNGVCINSHLNKNIRHIKK